jgi:hypothetical protein
MNMHVIFNTNLDHLQNTDLIYQLDHLAGLMTKIVINNLYQDTKIQLFFKKQL